MPGVILSVSCQPVNLELDLGWSGRQVPAPVRSAVLPPPGQMQGPCSEGLQDLQM